jgi:hypothetical protein
MLRSGSRRRAARFRVRPATEPGMHTARWFVAPLLIVVVLAAIVAILRTSAFARSTRPYSSSLAGSGCSCPRMGLS